MLTDDNMEGKHITTSVKKDKLKEWYVNTPIMFKIILLIVILQVVVNYRQNDIQPFIYTQF